jgi:YidC/Oxa1 family membrane protein insertase
MGFLGRLFGPLTAALSGALEAFHSLGAPWWLAVALLTISARMLLLPLTMKQVTNMRAMQELRPEMERIRSEHKNDRSKQQEAITELYHERKINPLAGFLPILVQIPVFITMYRVIRFHEQTFHGFASGGLLWFSDLTRADPYFVLPVLSATILLLTSEVSARNVDPAQRRLMRLLPVVFTAFMARFPAGLFVYWISSNLFSLAQNLLVYRQGSRLSAADTGEAEYRAGNNRSDSPNNHARKRSRTRRRKKTRKKN